MVVKSNICKILQNSFTISVLSVKFDSFDQKLLVFFFYELIFLIDSQFKYGSGTLHSTCAENVEDYQSEIFHI